MYSINWNITRACNLRCRHCYYDAGTPLNDELSTEEAFILIDEIAQVFGANANITFGGGEPLMRHDLLTIIAYAKDRGLHLTLASNGTMLTDELVYQLREAGIEEVIIPIDGTPETHDIIRGAGVYTKAVRSARACVEAGMSLVIDPCIMKENEDETSAIIHTAVELGARQCRFFHYIALGRGREEMPVSELSRAEYARNLMLLYEEQSRIGREIEICTTQASQYWVILRRKAAEGLFVPDFFFSELPGCRAATGMLSIKPNGDVVPCPLLDVRVGNIREHELREMLDSEVFSSLRNRDVKGKCARCRHRDICGGCRVRAYLHTGDYLAEDPLCGDFFFEPEDEGEDGGERR